MKWFLAGNRGLVGTNFSNTYSCTGVNTSTCDLEKYSETLFALYKENPTHVMINAATVGGIMDDIKYPFDIYIRNMTKQNNIFKACKELNIKNVLLQGSTCSYPATEDKFIEEDLFKGKPHESYLSSALIKLIGLEQCRAANKLYNFNWKTAVLTNLFGPYDKVGEIAHATGAIMEKFVNNNGIIEIWGSGKQERDFTFVEDIVDGCILAAQSTDTSPINLGTGKKYSVMEVVSMICEIMNWKPSSFQFDKSKPSGALSRALDNSRAKEILGWEPKISIKEGLKQTIDWYVKTHQPTGKISETKLLEHQS